MRLAQGLVGLPLGRAGRFAGAAAGGGASGRRRGCRLVPGGAGSGPDGGCRRRGRYLRPRTGSGTADTTRPRRDPGDHRPARPNLSWQPKRVSAGAFWRRSLRVSIPGCEQVRAWLGRRRSSSRSPSSSSVFVCSRRCMPTRAKRSCARRRMMRPVSSRLWQRRREIGAV